MANYLRRSRVYKNRRQSAKHSIRQHSFKKGGNPPKLEIKSGPDHSSFAMGAETLDKKKDGSELGIQVDIDSNGKEGESIVDSEEDWIDDETQLVDSHAKPAVKRHIRLASTRTPKAALAAFRAVEERHGEVKKRDFILSPSIDDLILLKQQLYREERKNALLRKNRSDPPLSYYGPGRD